MVAENTINKYLLQAKLIFMFQMTDDKRQEMKKYKEKAMAFEHKLKGKRVSLDSGVMITSTEMQKLENCESPTTVLKELVYYDVNNTTTKIATQNTMKTDGSLSPETPTIVSEEEEYNLNDSSIDKTPINIKSDNVSLVKNSCDTLTSKQESTNFLNITNSTIQNDDNLKDISTKTESINRKSENSPINSYYDTLIPKQESTHVLTVSNSTIYDNDNTTVKQVSRLRSNSYTLSSPSPVMVAFLNSQIQQQLIEPKSLENNIKESKSEPPSIYVDNECNDKISKTKSISLNSVSEPLHNQELGNNLVMYKNPNVINRQMDNKIVSDQKQDESGSMNNFGNDEKGSVTNFSNDESLVGSVITVFNGNSFENNSSPSSITCKSMKHCCCRHSDDEYSLSSNNIHYKTPEELNREAERLRIVKLDLERRHQDELSNLIRKQREEQEKIAVRYYLISQSTSEMSLDDSECSESLSKQLKSNSSSIHSVITLTNDKSMQSDTSSIISNCSITKNLACSSPRQNISSQSPNLHQNIKFYHRIRNGRTKTWTKAPTEVENAAATIINASVRGYLTRRLLRTEKAQLLKKTILDSLKTALIMHMELKKQQPTESDLELHRRIINQVTYLPTY